MKPFWLGLLGSFVGVMLLGAMAFYTDIFTIDRDGAPKFRVSDAGKITVGATESYVNLVIQNNGAAPNNKVDITADVLTVEGIRLENVNVAADITASGAGGLDTGSEATSTWYYVWVITNNDGTSSNGLLSASSTSPTLPSGFTKKRRVGAVRNNASNDFLQFVQEGNRCAYLDATLTNRIVTGGQATTFTTISAANFIPPTSRRGVFNGIIMANYATTGLAEVLRVRKTGSSGTNGQFVTHARSQVNGVDFRASTTGDVDTNASQQIDYMLDVLPTSGGANIDVLGYYDRI